MQYKSLVDQYGNPVSSNFFKSTKRDSELPIDVSRAKPFGIDGISHDDHLRLIGQSRLLYSNNGIYKALCEFFAVWSIQDSFRFVWQGSDAGYGAEVSEWLDNYFFNSPNLTKNHSFKSQLYLDCVGMDRDADSFSILTKDVNGYPRILSYPSFTVHSGIDSNSDVVTVGKYKGARINKGIITDRFNQIVAYRFVSEKTYRDVAAQYVLHQFDNTHIEQNRGIPLLAHGIKSLAQVDKSIDFELLAMMINSSISLIETNESGGMESDPMAELFNDSGSSTSAGNPTSIHDLNGGVIKYFKGGTGSKLEVLNNSNRPSINYNMFADRMYKQICAGTGISFSLLMEESNPSVATRSQLKRTEIAIKDRQVILKENAKKMINYAISVGIAKGDLKPNLEYTKFDLTLPAPLTIDVLKDGNDTRANLECGILNYRDVLDSKGKSPDTLQHFKIRAQEKAEKIIAAKEINQKYGVDIKPEEI